jgi:hypothetical protein
MGYAHRLTPRPGAYIKQGLGYQQGRRRKAQTPRAHNQSRSLVPGDEDTDATPKLRETRRAEAYTRKVSLVSFDKHAQIDLEESAIGDTSKTINPLK